MDKDNSQEPMITSNSPSLEKGREKVYYSSNPAFYVGIDCIIFGFYEGEISLLLLKRNFEPAMGEWSLMGGFVQNNESVDDAAKRVLHELTGLETFTWNRWELLELSIAIRVNGLSPWLIMH